jgi:hypothetical protein
MRVLVVLAGASLAAMPGVAVAQTSNGARPDPTVAFVVSDARINEASGLAVSRRHPGVVYVHNDSGGSPRIFAVGPDGRTKATLTIAGAGARDWEALALGRDEAGRPALFVADIGDNLNGAWPQVTVYRVREPTRLSSRTLQATVFRMRYADGPRNAESLLINPVTGRLYIASKEFAGGLYAAPARLRTDRVNVLRRIAKAPAMATDGAYAPDGRTFVIRTYFSAHVFSAPDRLMRVVSLPNQEQGESIAFTADGRSLLAGSEGVRQPLYRVPLPASALPPSPRASPRNAAAERREAGREDSSGQTVLLIFALGIAGAITYGLAKRHS